MKAFEMLSLCIGKTVASVSVDSQNDPDAEDMPSVYGGLSLTFTDGSTLELKEQGQAGEIQIEQIPTQQKPLTPEELKRFAEFRLRSKNQ